MVGVLDIDWLLEPRFTRLLDNLAASPGAFGAVRFFGALSSGEKENVFPGSSGTVWRSSDAPIDFSVTMRALEALVTRRLVPFVGLTFFPSAVSPKPIQPPPSFDNWQTLVQAFLDQSVQRFGAAEVGRWWLEVWNEPNMPPFWGGSFDQYLDLYRATSDVVQRSGYTIRIGGPVVAYMPDEGAMLVERFLDFLHREPTVKCDFISLHRKGIWTNQEAQPDLQRSVAAARQTAQAALRIDADRFRGMPIINNEADMKVAFNTPYEPRMTEQFASWLMAQTIAYDQLNAEFSAAGFRFWAASDNANQQLIQEPFDGRRSIMTRLDGPDDLVKVPVYGFYELLRLLQRSHGSVRNYPQSDLYHLTTTSPEAVAAVFTLYPGNSSPNPAGRQVQFLLRDVPWQRVNIARFCINDRLSNSYAAAGRTMPVRIVNTDMTQRIRMAQELGVLEPIRRNVALPQGELRESFHLQAFATVLVWVTPFQATPPATPQWLQAETIDGNVMLRWTPNTEPWFYSYGLQRHSPEPDTPPLSPMPLRAAAWVDRPPPGRYIYRLYAVSASGVRSETVMSQEIAVSS
ncbi:MAG: GH39 family glycosyl hydrolase [Rhodopila sp.]